MSNLREPRWQEEGADARRVARPQVKHYGQAAQRRRRPPLPTHRERPRRLLRQAPRGRRVGVHDMK